MRTTNQINAEINEIFAKNGVEVDGPGDEAFWNAVDDLGKLNPDAATRMHKLSDEWEVSQ